MEELLIVTTGGTIDKVYFDDKSDFQVGEPQIGRILQELGVAFRFSVIPIMRKDSLHINAADRELMRAAIAAQPARHVLVTHGTDTMVETAQVLAAIAGKTIVLTGALNPAGSAAPTPSSISARRWARCSRLPPGRLHRHERPRLGSGKRAQERRRQPLRSRGLSCHAIPAHKKEPRPKPGFSFVALPLTDQLWRTLQLTPEYAE